jgi:hypothetical protein
LSTFAKGNWVSGTDIFLSYARHDRATARAFADCLAEEGFKVWWDASLHSGETFDEVIERNLRDAKAVASRWVRAEATLADRRNKLVPAIIEACDRPIVFELTHTAELADWHGDRSDPRWRNFVEDLGRLIQGGDEEAAGAQHAPVSSRPEPVGRHPLRPGSDQVIASDRFRHNSRRAATEDTAAPSEVHCLEVEGGELPEEVIVIDSSSLKIGRTAPADIVLSHRTISREHCIVGLANDELLVTDLNSTNGTYIDDARISRASILPVGSVLRLGDISLRHSVLSPADADHRSSGPGSPHSQRVAANS